MDIIITLVVGGVVGWLASILMKTSRQMGIIANVVVGVVGSILGGWVAALIGLAAVSAIGSLIVKIGGAALLIAILKGLKFLK